MKKESPVKIETTGAPEIPMTLDTAADLAQSLVTRFAVPLMRIEEIVRVAKDSKNLMATYETQIPELEGRLAALGIEEAAATARVANATARAAEAKDTAERQVQDAALRAATARDNTAQRIEEIERELGARREKLEAEYATRKHTLNGLLVTAQQALDALTRQYEELLAAARAKFGGP